MMTRTLALFLLLGCSLAQNVPYRAKVDSNTVATDGNLTWRIQDSTGALIAGPITSTFSTSATASEIATFLRFKTSTYETRDLNGNTAVTANAMVLAPAAPPTAHTHLESEVTNLVTDLAAKESALTFSAPLSRTTNTISCPTCLTTNAVGSVFGRTGAVVAAANDYTFAQLASKPTTVAGYGITDTLTKVAAGTATFTTTAVASLACQATVTVAASGALTTDKAQWVYASAPVAATDMRLTLNVWLTAGNINFARCNNTASSITPTALVLNWAVTR